jgi:16S rRNA (uracil1498-N3)-methyltransferase
VTFDADETRHLKRVLRLGPGDIVEALDGAGTMLTVRIESAAPRGAEGMVLSRVAHRTESPLRLVLAQGIAKGDKMETIIRMATELGVSQVVPLATTRAVVKFEAGRREARVVPLAARGAGGGQAERPGGDSRDRAASVSG